MFRNGCATEQTREIDTTEQPESPAQPGISTAVDEVGRQPTERATRNCADTGGARPTSGGAAEVPTGCGVGEVGEAIRYERYP